MKRGFTDKLYALNFTCTILLTTASITITAFSGILGISDLSPISTAIQYSFLQLSVHSGFVVWKAKAENINKNKMNEIKEGIEIYEDEQ